jgi:hypothetical protein
MKSDVNCINLSFQNFALLAVPRTVIYYGNFTFITNTLNTNVL